MTEVRSSWSIVNGVVTPLGEEPRGRQGLYTCLRCGEHGHNTRTCGLTDEERKEQRR